MDSQMSYINADNRDFLPAPVRRLAGKRGESHGRPSETKDEDGRSGMHRIDWFGDRRHLVLPE